MGGFDLFVKGRGVCEQRIFIRSVASHLRERRSFAGSFFETVGVSAGESLFCVHAHLFRAGIFHEPLFRAGMGIPVVGLQQ